MYPIELDQSKLEVSKPLLGKTTAASLLLIILWWFTAADYLKIQNWDIKKDSIDFSTSPLIPQLLFNLSSWKIGEKFNLPLTCIKHLDDIHQHQ